MKIVFQNPHMADQPFGIHNYVIHYLLKYRPYIYITPGRRYARWLQFLVKNRLPLAGWRYILSESQLNQCDAWLCFSGTCAIIHEPLPLKFKGLKIYHVMDYSYSTKVAASKFNEAGVDYLLGYSRHDQFCEYFKGILGNYKNRVIPWPFGYGKRFHVKSAFTSRSHKCSVMGALVPMKKAEDGPEELKDYLKYFEGNAYAHTIRAAISGNIEHLGDLIESYLPRHHATKNLAYDSPTELNRHQLFLNDDSIMHYPPARTYEGSACGAVMVCSDYPCYEDFSWKGGLNCITHKYGDVDDCVRAIRAALADQQKLARVQQCSMFNSKRFSHANIGDRLNALIELLLKGKSSEALNMWRVSGNLQKPLN